MQVHAVVQELASLYETQRIALTAQDAAMLVDVAALRVSAPGPTL